jgi:arsenate reductase
MTRRVERIRIIALDVENAVRSQMAEAFLRDVGGQRVEACSGGIRPQPLHPLTVRVMGEVGLDLAGQASKSAQRFFGQAAFQFAVLLTHADEAGSPRLFPGALAIERWPTDDPLQGEMDDEGRLERFRASRDQIRAHVHDWWVRMAEAAPDSQGSQLLSSIGH